MFGAEAFSFSSKEMILMFDDDDIGRLCCRDSVRLIYRACEDDYTAIFGDIGP